jgi:PKD repeat protein
MTPKSKILITLASYLVPLTSYLLPLPVLAQTNLITNGSFESNFTGWSGTQGISIVSDAYHGTRAARFLGSNANVDNLLQQLSAQAGKTYKISLWVKINPATSCSGDCWGGFRPRLDNWPGLTGSTQTSYLTPSSRPVGEWFKESFEFTVGSTTTGQLKIGPFGGTNWNWDVVVDDVQFFEVTGEPQPPQVSISSNTTNLTSIPATVQFTSSADDPDGSVDYYFWDFGDGGKSNLTNPPYTYTGNGTYTAKLTVFDDSGLSATATRTITVSDSNYPTLSITSPSTSPHTTSSSSITIQGTASGGTISRVDYSTDRGAKGTASGTTQWSFSLNLANLGGPHRVLVNAYNSLGHVATKEIIITYLPSSKVTIQNGALGVTHNATSIERYDKFEATFSLQNSVAANPYFPYEINSSIPNFPQGTGISVSATFTSPSGRTYTQPGFYYQPYTRSTNPRQLIAQGNPVWKIRFAPPETGTYTYTLTVTDASGTTTISDSTRLRFSVTTQSNPHNRGFIKVSHSDPRYFEFSDGTPFIGIGPGAYLQDSFATDTNIARIGLYGANLTRTWMSASNIAGSSWAPWSGGIDYVGNFPGTSLTTGQAYGAGLVSLTLPQPNSSAKKCAFYGFQGTKASIKPNTNYRVLVRAKALSVTGSGGLTFRPGVGWPDTCDSFAGSSTPIPHIKGTKDWHTVTGTWNSGSRTVLGYALITLENTTGGRVFIDEVSLREDLGNGLFGPEVLPRSNFNTHTYFSQEPSWNWDYGLDEMAARGLFQKIVIAEKQDYLFNNITPYGYAVASGQLMQRVNGAGRKYQEYYWRYLTARYGYSRAVHSWEYVNEDAPGNLTFANAMAKYFHSIDPRQTMATTSFWCCIQKDGTYYWKDPAYPDVDYADTHVYVAAPPDDTSWLSNNVDPDTGTNMSTDTALFTVAHSLDAWRKNAFGSKPAIMGEAGVGYNNIIAGKNDTDTQGVWFHQHLWAQINPGSMYFLYWYDDTIVSNDFYSKEGFYKTYRRFFEGVPGDSINKRIPINNGSYRDIQLTLPSNVHGWGQKDTVNGGAYFWAYDKNYTWINRTGGSSLGGKTFSLSGLPSRSYLIEYWNTWTGQVTTENRTHSGTTMTLTIPSTLTNKDVAVKIIPSTGYPGPTPPPIASPTPTGIGGPSPTPTNYSLDSDTDIDIYDILILISRFTQNLVGDFNQNGRIDIFDFNTLLKNRL